MLAFQIGAYIICSPFIILYNLLIDSWLYSTAGPQSTQAAYQGAVGEDVPPPNGLNPPEGTKPKPPDNKFKWTAEVIVYATIHTFLTNFMPGYILVVIFSRIFVILWRTCAYLVLTDNKYADLAWEIMMKINEFFKIGNAFIDKVNSMSQGYFRIRKSVESISNYSFTVVAFISIGLFYVIKKWFVKKGPEPQAKDNKFQNILQLGVMVIGFIGWSDFGLWRDLQNWIRMSTLFNKVFGDNADYDACSNYKKREDFPHCHSNRSGPSPCVACVADKVSKDPRVVSQVNLEYTASAIYDNPSAYFYPLVKDLFMNDKKVPQWYLKLNRTLQDSIFTSHYKAIDALCESEKYGLTYRLNHERMIKGWYMFVHDQSKGAWTIATPNYKLMHNDEMPKTSEPTILTHNYQNRVEEDDRSSQSSEDCNYPSDKEIEEKHQGVTPQSQEPDYHAEVFQHRSIRTDGEVISFLKDFPPIFKPCIFLAGMCLILYATYYYYRKRNIEKIQEKVINKTQEIQEEKAKEVLLRLISQGLIDQQYKPIPPVLKDITTTPETLDLSKTQPQLNQKEVTTNEQSKPEVLGGNKSSYKRHGKHNQRHRMQRYDEEQDIMLKSKTTFEKNKTKRQKRYVFYDLSDLNNMIQSQGLLMVNKDDEAETATTLDEYRNLIANGFEPFHEDLLKIAKGTADLTGSKYQDKIDLDPFKAVANLRPIRPDRWEDMEDFMKDGDVKPDEFWQHKFKKYKYNRERGLFMPESNDRQQAFKIMKREINAVEKQNQELSTPAHVTEETYDKLDKMLDQYIPILGSDELAGKLKEIMHQTNVSQPETNVSDIHSDECPAGDKCRIPNCVKQHKVELVKPEAMCGPIPIKNYPLTMNSNNCYKIYRVGTKGEHHATCFHVLEGFITSHHTFFVDTKKREIPIPPNELEVEILGERYQIRGFERIPDFKNAEGELYPSVFQDGVRFQLIDKTIEKRLPVAKAREPRCGEKVVLVSCFQIDEKEYDKRDPHLRSSIKTQDAILDYNPSDGHWTVETNNDSGDSGSGIYSIEQNGNVVGIYFGKLKNGKNTFIPFNAHHLPYINSGQPFKGPKNSQPVV